MAEEKKLPAGKSANGWRQQVKKDGSTAFAPEAGRYLLYVSYGCPFAMRTLLARAIKGLEKAIPLVVVHPIKEQTRPDKDYKGWAFRRTDEFVHTSEEPEFGVQYVQDLYEKVGDFDGPFSVPILWDTKTKTIVNNESAEIVRIFDSEFDEFAERPNVHFSPAELLPQIDETNDWVHKEAFFGLFGVSGAKTQADYDAAIYKLEATFDKLEAIFAKQRYLNGERFTESDIRLFVTTMIFDSVCSLAFRTNRIRVVDRPNLFNATRELYQLFNVKDTVQPSHYLQAYRNMPQLWPSGIIPAPPRIDWSAPHDREKFKGRFE